MFNGIWVVDSIIKYKTRLVIFNIERRQILIIFNIIATHKNQLIIGNKWLKEFNLDISQKTKTLKQRDTQLTFNDQVGCLYKKGHPLDKYKEKVVYFISLDKPDIKA